MATTQQVVVGVFGDHSQAEQAVDQLLRTGFGNDQIRYSGHGASTGGMLATLKSLFTGQETGSVYDDLVDLGVSQEDASSYQHEFEAGRSIVAVLAGGREAEATSVMSQYGGYGSSSRISDQANDYSTATTAGNYSTAGSDVPQTRDYNTANTVGEYGTTSTDMPQTDVEGEQRLKLREEQLSAQKQTVQTGEARLRKDVVSEQQSIDVPVTHEEVYVERRPGSGQPSDTPIGESGETYRVPVREEQVTTNKQTVETGEVAIGKKQFQETQRVSDTVRREEAHVENSGNVNVQGSNAEDIADRTDQSTL